jgi:hypothetical protein
MKTPEYVTKEPWSYKKSFNTEPVNFPAGSFMKPIDPYYLPKHVLDSDEYRWSNKNTETFAYTRIGIIPVPKDLLRKV